MRIVIDLNRCLGYAQCVPLAPEVLKLSGEEALTYNPNPDDSQRLRVLRAAAKRRRGVSSAPTLRPPVPMPLPWERMPPL